MRVIAHVKGIAGGAPSPIARQGGDPQRGPKGHFPADEDVQRTPAHRRGKQAARPVPGINGLYHGTVGFGGGGKCGATQSMARGHSLTCAIKGRQL